MRIQTKRHCSGVHERTIRTLISFPEEQDQLLERIVADNKVSLAWVIRDSIDRCLKSKWALLPQSTDAKDAQQRSERA